MSRIEAGTKLYVAINDGIAIGPEGNVALTVVVMELEVAKGGSKQILLKPSRALNFVTRLVIVDDDMRNRGYAGPFDNLRVRFSSEEALRYFIERSKQELVRLQSQMTVVSNQLNQAESLLVETLYNLKLSPTAAEG